MIVLWTFAVLAALAGEFAIAMRREAESTRNFKQEALAHSTAVAGLNEALLAIEAFNGELGYDDEDQKAGLSAKKKRGKDNDESSGMDLIRTLIEGRGQWVPGHLSGAGYSNYEVRAIDETGKIPLNASGVNETFLRQILVNLGIKDETADIVSDSIMDWRDADDLHRANGAEDDYYRGLDRPYPCKDAAFDAIEELQLVRGVTRSMYYGDGTTPGLRDIFTVAHDRSRLTIRTVSEAVEWALCGDPAERGLDEAGLRERTDEQQVVDVQSCIPDGTLGVRRGEQQGRPQLSFATVEARVTDPVDKTRVIAHVGARVQFKPGGGSFQTTQWYDSIFDE
jgi:general secretion pathway protein K